MFQRVAATSLCLFVTMAVAACADDQLEFSVETSTCNAFYATGESQSAGTIADLSTEVAVDENQVSPASYLSDEIYNHGNYDGCCDSGCCDTGCCDTGFDSICSSGCCDGWQTKLMVYGWLYELHGKAGVRGVTADVNISTRDMLNFVEHNVHFLESARIEAQRGPLTLYIDSFYVNAGLGGNVRRLNFSSGYKETILEVSALYELKSVAEMLSLPEDSRLEVLAGGRYHGLKANLTVTGPLGNMASTGGDRQWVDPIIGGRYTAPIAEGTTFQMRGDVGGFGIHNSSDFTWNVEAILNFECSECMSLFGGYRLLDIDIVQGSGSTAFTYDMQYRGPISGLEFTF